jgi:RNA polymerase sigma-70 factor (ECF subfamily)
MKEQNRASPDQSWLEALYARLERPIYNVVYRWVWDREEARDLVQEAFFRLWNMRHRVHMETVEPLIYRIAVNLAANRRRAKKIRRWIALEAAGEVASENHDEGTQLEIREREQAVRRAVDKLPERLRRIVLLCEFSGLTYEQIGNSLGIPSGTVGSRRNAALKLLHEQLSYILGNNHGREST